MKIVNFLGLLPVSMRFVAFPASDFFKNQGKPIMLSFSNADFKVKDGLTTIIQIASICMPIEQARQVAADIISTCDQIEEWGQK